MIDCRQLRVQQGEFVLGPLSFSVPRGAYGVIMGPTGCGKTTLIELIAGLRRPDSGQVILNGRNITKLDPAARCIGYVPQDGAMFPTMSVAGQLAFGLRVRRFDVQQWILRLRSRGRMNATLEGKMLRSRSWLKERWIQQRVTHLARLLMIDHLLERLPQSLSGGERQRVALGRALAIEPDLLLLDEPLAALDEDKRLDMCDLLKKIHHQFTPTVLHITHSLAEADRLATHHFRMSRGQISDTFASSYRKGHQ